jgi:hypothetical protein
MLAISETFSLFADNPRDKMHDPKAALESEDVERGLEREMLYSWEKKFKQQKGDRKNHEPTITHVIVHLRATCSQRAFIGQVNFRNK